MNPATLRIHQSAMRIFAENGGLTIAVSDLAREAGLARGTIYNNLADPSELLASVCDTVSNEYRASMLAACAAMTDPAEKIAAVIRLTVRRVHDEPHWGKFLARYAMMEPKLGSFWAEMPAQELRRGIASGRFAVHRDQVPSITATAGGGAATVLKGVLAL